MNPSSFLRVAAALALAAISAATASGAIADAPQAAAPAQSMKIAQVEVTGNQIGDRSRARHALRQAWQFKQEKKAAAERPGEPRH